MEKIININLAGRVIAIEDSAYTSLKAYLESLHRYFSAEEGRDEIINDIESRIAELLEEKIKRGATAITEADVQEIVGGMGRVEDFAAEEGTSTNAGAAYTAPRSSKGSKRFYRDENDKIAGGVCSGLASYLNVDPALIRVVFAILALGGWGTGVLLYIVLWIFVPARPIEGFRGRRLFRSEDDKWIGGVASGLATYFDKEAWMFRLAFAAPFILSAVSSGIWEWHSSLFFGSFTGTFALIYIVLWVVLPLAKTQFEKMEMRGEKVDLATIRQNVAANLGDVKGRVKEWGTEVSQSATQFYNSRGREFGREAAGATRTIASRGGHIIATIFKAFFFFIGAIIAFSLFMALIGYSFGGFSGLVNGFIIQDKGMQGLGWATVILCLGVPLVAIVTFITRRALRIRGGGRYFTMGFTLLLVAGIICATFLIAHLTREFSRNEELREEVAIAQPTGGRLVLDVPGDGIEYSNSVAWLHGDIHGWDVQGDVMRSAAVGVSTKPSPDSLYHVYIRRYSGGRNAAEAKSRAGGITYSVRSTGDSLLSLDNGFTVTKAQGYRGQNVEVEVQVPVGKKIRFNESVEDKLSANRVMRRHYRSHGRNRNAHWDIDETWDGDDWDADVDYVMQPNGKLLDPLHPEGRPDRDDDDSRYYRSSVRHELEDARRQIREAGEEARRAGRAFHDDAWRQDSVARAENAAEREKELKKDSLDRAIEALQRQKERID